MTPDPDATANRAEHARDHAARMVVWWHLRGNANGVLSAVDYADRASVCIDTLPRTAADIVAGCIDHDLPDRDVIAAALSAIANRAGAGRLCAEIALHKIARTVEAALPDAPRWRLEQRLLQGDLDFDARCRLAAAMFHVGDLCRREDYRERGMALALRECHRYPSIDTGVVLATIGDVVPTAADPDGTVNPDRLVAALLAEWARVAGVMCWPEDNDDEPGGDWSDVFGDDEPTDAT